MTTLAGQKPALRYRLAARWQSLVTDPNTPGARGVVHEPGLRGETTRDLGEHATGGRVYASEAHDREPGVDTAAMGFAPATPPQADPLTGPVTVPAGDPPMYLDTCRRFSVEWDRAGYGGVS